MIRERLALALCLLSATLISACAAHGGAMNAVAFADVCAVAREAAAYDGKRIQVQGRALPPDHGPMRLTSEDCRGAIALRFDEHLIGTPEKKRLDSEVWTGFESPEEGVFVTVTGKFIHNPGRRPSRILVVTSIEFPAAGR